MTINADAPAPTDAGSFATSFNNLGLSNASTIFLEYTWVTGTGETLPFSTPVSFTIPPSNGVNLTYSVPTAPAGFNIVNANIYMGTSTVPTAELLKATVAPGSTTIIGSLATGKAVPTSSTAGVPAGTYYRRSARLVNKPPTSRRRAASSRQSSPPINSSERPDCRASECTGSGERNSSVNHQHRSERRPRQRAPDRFGRHWRYADHHNSRIAGYDDSDASGDQRRGFCRSGTYYVQYTWSSRPERGTSPAKV